MPKQKLRQPRQPKRRRQQIWQQQKQRKQHEERVKTLKKGDEIVTAGGIVGEVLHIASQGKDGAATLADRITIKSGESKLIVERGRIAAVGGSAPAA